MWTCFTIQPWNAQSAAFV